MQQFITPTDLAALPEDQQNLLWKWANRTKFDRPEGMGISGMPLLSIGRLIEYLIDHGVPMKEFMTALVVDFYEEKGQELIDILWVCVIAILAKKKIKFQNKNLPKLKRIRPKDLVTKGTMQQWITASQWKQLTDTEMARMWKWADNSVDDTRLFKNLSECPMLSIGRLLECLIDHGMTLKEIFQDCMKYENQEWGKMQLIDILWEKVRIILKLSILSLHEEKEVLE